MNKTYTLTDAQLDMLLRQAINAYKETRAALYGRLETGDFEEAVTAQAVGEVMGELRAEQDGDVLQVTPDDYVKPVGPRPSPMPKRVTPQLDILPRPVYWRDAEKFQCPHCQRTWNEKDLDGPQVDLWMDAKCPFCGNSVLSAKDRKRLGLD